jgi:DNA primase
MSSREKLEILKGILDFSHYSREEGLFKCPFCNHHKPKMSINVEKNVYKCWICDSRGKDVWRIVRKFGDTTDKRKWKSFSGDVDLNDSLYDSIFGIDVEEKQTIDLPEEFISLANKKQSISSKRPMRYLADRGVTKKDIIRWKIGYCSHGEYKNRIIIPSFDKDGDVNYFVSRSYSGDWMKYKNPDASKDVVFNELNIDWKDKIFLVEGVFDAIKAGTDTVPLLGSTLNENSKLFQKIVENDTAIYLALDPDAEKKSMHIIKSLLQHGIEIHKIDIGDEEDVGDMTPEHFSSIAKTALQFTSDKHFEKILEGI